MPIPQSTAGARPPRKTGSSCQTKECEVTTTEAGAGARIAPAAEHATAEVAASLAIVGHAIFALMQPGSLDDIGPLGTPVGRPAPAVPSPVTEPVEDQAEPSPSAPAEQAAAAATESPAPNSKARPASVPPAPVPTAKPGPASIPVPVPVTVAVPAPVPDPAPDSPPDSAPEVPAYRAQGRSTLSMLNEIGFLDD